MHVLTLGGRILDRARKEEKLVCRGPKRGLMKDDGVGIIGVAGLKPGWQVPGDQ